MALRHRRVSLLVALGVVAGMILLGWAGCARRHHPRRATALDTPPAGKAAVDPAFAEPLTRDRIEADRARLSAFAAELRQQEEQMNLLRRLVTVDKRGHFSTDETDRIQGLLFRFLGCREALLSISAYYAGRSPLPGSEELETQGFLVGFLAGLLDARSTSRLVATFVTNDDVTRKLNESYFRYDIPAGTYDALLRTVTDPDASERLNLAWDLYAAETRRLDSALVRLVSTAPVWAEMSHEIDRLYTDTRLQVGYVLHAKAILLPEIENEWRQSWLARHAAESQQVLATNLADAKGVLYESVSRLKQPLSWQADFSPDQIRDIKTRLEPGDIILTYSAGYMSNLFLPGKFKHGITYVGTPAQRAAAGLTAERFADVPEPLRQKAIRALALEALPSGAEADVIEAVAEGVIFSSLQQLLRTHMFRMAVLRPRLNPAERVEQLKTVILLLGQPYDFDFDFDDANCQCCTEVIYRALHRRAAIDFALVPRMGVQTLSADDLIQYALQEPKQPFGFVLYAEPTSSLGPQRPVLHAGASGETAFRRLMGL